MSIRLALVEDCCILREGIAAILARESDFEIVAGVATADDLLKLPPAFAPDVLLVDAGMQTCSPASLVTLARHRFPMLGAVAINVVPGHDGLLDFIRAGVSAFVVRKSTIEELMATIRAVAAGAHVLPQTLASALFTEIARTTPQKTPANISVTRMTRREREIVHLVAAGLSNKEIAERLNIATHTVKSHVHNVLEKLGARRRVQLAALGSVPKSSQRVTGH